MLLKKLWRTVKLYKAQFISMIIMMTLGIGIFVGFNMEWASIRGNTTKFFKDTGYADYRIISDSGFSEAELNSIKEIDGVDYAARYVSVNADIKERSGDSASLTVTTNETVSGFIVTDGESYDPESTDGIWLSDKYASANDFKTGDVITLVYKNIEISGKIKGLIKSGEHMICVRDSSQLMPDLSTYGFAYISPALYKNAARTEFYSQINVISSMEPSEFKSAANKALGKTALIFSKEESSIYTQADGEVDEGKAMGAILPALFLLIAVLTMITTMQRITAKEKTQIGTLKALGFKDKQITRHYTSYTFMIGVIGSVFGTALGYAIAWYIMNPNGMMGTYMDMPDWKLYLPWFCYVVIAAIIIMLTLIGALSVKKMLSGSAADALRPYVPKRMKALIIERAAWFHKLSFGTRWNLRDIMRHKARTAMSLIGIVGSMTIIVASLGMSNTMDAFLDTYYNKALNYSSVIYLSEQASNEQSQSIAELYNGDWSSSVGVQIADRSISLDIYSLNRDKIKFPDEDLSYAEIKGDGAYICMRIADELALSSGDTIKISPYGSDKEYTLKINGIIRSVSESIVISKEYAKELGIEYTINAIYTDEDKANISSSSQIKSVQSKQAIIDSFDTMLGMMDAMIYILVVGALILGTIVLYSLGVMSYTERYREMATLKVIGFKNKKIGSLLIGQNIWLSIAGSIIGLPLGIFTLSYLLKALAPEYEMKMSFKPETYIISFLLTLGMSLIVSLMVSSKNKKIDMAQALKDAE